jgi:ubiquinone/menaquinone biosynthesis C-methylase UbiE
MADNLREVYNQIAPSWYNYRHHTIFRRELETLAAEWQNGRLLNIGCGHGADFLPFAADFELHGIDFSEEMLKLARKYAEKYKFRVDLAVADACALPYSDACFDYAIAVATYHHLTGEQRLPAFRELKRILKPGGLAFITVWNRWQLRFWLRRKELLIPWRMKEKTLYRYYHLFSYSELTRLTEQAGLEVVRAFPESNYHFPIRFFSRNICLLVRKAEKDA